MKTTRLLFWTLLAISFLPCKVNSQVASITNLKIIPINPITTDNVKVIANTYFSSAGCVFKSSSKSISSTTINVNARHDIGILTMLCYSTDTINIGQLQPGTYELIYHLLDDFYPITYDIDTIYFNVQQATGIQSIYNSNDEYKIYPIPTTSTFYIDFLTESHKKHDVEIFNMFGQKIKTIKEVSNKTAIEITNLTNGTYCIEFSIGDIRHRTKIIKNAL